MDMDIERKKTLSVYYFVKDLFEEYPFVKIVDEYDIAELKPPIVAVVAHELRTYPFEIGNRRGQRERTWSLDIYAQTKTQRDEFGYFLMNNLEDLTIPVYNYDEGFPPDVEPTQLGGLVTSNQSYLPMPVHPDLVDKLYYRATVRFYGSYTE